ncbi:hypothetical protein [Aquiflexum gelatinilyticum]|uniref:Uncharacterized protein n=1 Tax=Aquiflexum gelatinilyticum TaxID=2961943 RepID=A0A9X2T144_9BACT|nr:hypothetical protein [Aquiflexum gelatinilyticum]MCR9014315.1 hypothetical protein [Aquiflexum gelatinilyticum]
MKNSLPIFVLLIFIFSSCDYKLFSEKYENEELKTYTGDLFFKVVDIRGYYNVPDSSIQNFEAMIKKMKSKAIIPDNEKRLIEFVELLKREELIDKPNFYLKLDSKILRVFLDEKDYQLIQDYNRNDLLSENKKVEISLMGTPIEHGIIKGFEINLVRKVDGITEWEK